MIRVTARQPRRITIVRKEEEKLRVKPLALACDSYGFSARAFARIDTTMDLSGFYRSGERQEKIRTVDWGTKLPQTTPNEARRCSGVHSGLRRAYILAAGTVSLGNVLVDLVGFEPTTSSMPWKRAPNCATGP